MSYGFMLFSQTFQSKFIISSHSSILQASWQMSNNFFSTSNVRVKSARKKQPKGCYCIIQMVLKQEVSLPSYMASFNTMLVLMVLKHIFLICFILTTVLYSNLNNLLLTRRYSSSKLSTFLAKPNDDEVITNIRSTSSNQPLQCSNSPHTKYLQFQQVQLI